MRSKFLAMAALAGTVAVTPAAPVRAGAGDAVAGAIIGAIIGSAIANQPRSTTTPRTSTAARPSSPNPAREANREVQAALNYFNFPVGTPDGVIGPKSRAAIAQYQALLGYPATGTLTEFERTILVTAWNWGRSGAPDAVRLMSGPQGPRALLVAQRDNMAGGRLTLLTGVFAGLPPEVSDSVLEIARNTNVEAEQLLQRHGFIQLADINGDGRTDYILDTSVTGSAFWCSAQACTVRVFASTPTGHQRNDFQAFNVTPAMFACQQGNCIKVGEPGRDTTIAIAPAAPPALPPAQSVALPVPPALPAAPNPAAQGAGLNLPSFMASGAPASSLASHCNRVSLVTNTNGGFVTLATMTDPRQALSEQFCLARTYAMAQAEEAMGRISGFTPQQIAEQCAGFGPALRELVAAVSLRDRDAVLRDAAQFVLATAMNPAQLAGTARICLGVGYTTDNMEVAIGSAVLLVALGERAYAELVGHHLVGGFGASPQAELALPWVEMALDSVAQGATMVFAPGMPDRSELIRRAIYAVNGRADAAVTPAAPTPAALPTFAIPRLPGLTAGGN